MAPRKLPPLRDPFLIPHTEARRLLGVQNSKYWALVRAGIIKTVKLGDRTQATFASVRRAACPDETPSGRSRPAE